MIYLPESTGDDLYSLLDNDQPSDHIWLEGDKIKQFGWECQLRPLINGRWGYKLAQCRGETRTWSYYLRGIYTERYEAIAACIRELESYFQKSDLYVARIKQQAEFDQAEVKCPDCHDGITTRCGELQPCENCRGSGVLLDESMYR